MLCTIHRISLGTLGLGLALTLWACDAPPSAVVKPAKDGTALSKTASYGEDYSQGRSDQTSRARQDVPLVNGVPLWTSTRKLSAQENAQKHFERDGQDFGARSVDEFVTKAHNFVSHPPKGTKTIVRPNGDTLFYDPKDNVFAVTTRSGAPRTLFKPDNGPEYWQEQVDREAKRKQAKVTSSRDGDQG
jgi:pyocin large subunit-like protein